ncbi:MAG: hypothetical protein A2V67_00550 [Deltaproteobacteria bacterium RBG_13_61_14]|nr:MAG: hypothetical protein A2V67_00550 [Deltaproteobacteria bacterium RBG_13_61_14]
MISIIGLAPQNMGLVAFAGKVFGIGPIGFGGIMEAVRDVESNGGYQRKKSKERFASSYPAHSR